MIYVPAVVASFFVLWPAMMQAERYQRMAQVFAFAVLLIGLVQVGFVVLFGAGVDSQFLATASILLLIALFFTGFNILEALQPSLISRIAPATGKARALGIYNTLQSLGLFSGGALGGWLLQTGGYTAVFTGCGALALIWLIILLKWPAKVPAKTPA